MQNIQGVDGSGLVVHLIEDDKDLAQYFQIVIQIAFPRTTIQLYRTNEEITSVLDSHTGKRVYIIDGKFPENFNSPPILLGPSLYQTIKTRYPNMPIIGNTVNIEDFTNLGLDSLKKQVNPNDIVTWIRESFFFLLYPEVLNPNSPIEIISEPIPQEIQVEHPVDLAATIGSELPNDRPETFVGKFLRRLGI